MPKKIVEAVKKATRKKPEPKPEPKYVVVYEVAPGCDSVRYAFLAGAPAPKPVTNAKVFVNGDEAADFADQYGGRVFGLNPEYSIIPSVPRVPAQLKL